MSQPLYFLPRVSWNRGQNLSVTRSIIREAGLADIFSDVSEDHVGWSSIDGKGPGDCSGTIICYLDNREPPRRQGFYPTEQKWSAVGDGSKLWIGLDKDSKAGPENLRRATQHRGWPIDIGGQEYRIPVIRRPDGHSELPSDMIFDAAGKLAYPLKPEYQDYFDVFDIVCEWWRTKELNIGEEDRAQALRLAIQAFGLNYRYGIAEHSVLRLIDKENFLTILALAIDLPRIDRIQEAQKKS